MKKILVMVVSLVSLIGCDRVTKMQAVESLKGNDPLSYFGGFFQLTYHENSGAMLSLGSNLPDNFRFYIFTLAVGFILFSALTYIFIKPLTKINLALALLIIGGGLGNLYDRAFNDGLVIDFMVIGIGSIKTGVFNVADIAIMAGAIGMFFFSSKWGSQLTKRCSRFGEKDSSLKS